MGQLSPTLVALALAVASAKAASFHYVTDLPVFSQLAPCAQYAVGENIQSQTYNACPEAVSDLQSCVCTKDSNSASISSKISASVSYSCGSTASEDQASAQTVFSAYCNPDATVNFPTPTAVSIYITDVTELSNLAPCASNALRDAIGTLTNDRCPSGAPALASCACFKNQNSLVVSQIINTSAKYSCSGHTADVSSAEAMFAAYCAMNNGTTSFPAPPTPSGDMTYYITDLTQFGALAPCAASALSYAVQSQTYNLCPSGPQALGSCVCLKDGMTSEVLKDITSNVKEGCSSTATEDVTSAVAVYNFYCSAVQAQVTPAGVTNSVDQTYPASRASGGPQETGGAQQTGGSQQTGGARQTGTGTGTGTGGQGNSSQGGSTSNSSSPNIGAIVGGIAGGVAFLLVLIIVGVMWYRRDKRSKMPGPAPPGSDNAYGPLHPTAPAYGKFELPNDSLAAAVPQPPPSPYKTTPTLGVVPARVDSVSPVHSEHTTHTPSANHAELSNHPTPSPAIPPKLALANPSPELYGQGAPPPVNRPELQGQGGGVLHATPPPHAPELYGQSAPPPPHAPELYGQDAPPPPHRPELQGQGAMYTATPPSHTPVPHGQGTFFHQPNPNRPELAGQGVMYPGTPPGNVAEVYGQGTAVHYARTDRPELVGEVGWAAASQGQGQGQQAYGQPHGQGGQPQQAWGHGQQPQGQAQAHTQPEAPSWQAGPVPGYYYEAEGDGVPPPARG